MRHGPWSDSHPVCTGVGPVAAAATTAMALAQGEFRGVVHLGIAGSFDLAAAPLGGVVVATHETWPEYGVRRNDGTITPLTFPMHPRLPRPSLPLDPTAAADAMGLALDPSWVWGPALTVAGVTGDTALASAYHYRFQALIESMEGFGVAFAAHLAGVPCLEIRTIANAVGERDKDRWNIPLALEALSQAAQLLLGDRA